MAKVWVPDARYPQRGTEWETIEPGVCVLCGQNYRAMRERVDELREQIALLKTTLENVLMPSPPSAKTRRRRTKAGSPDAGSDGGIDRQ